VLLLRNGVLEQVSGNHRRLDNPSTIGTIFLKQLCKGKSPGRPPVSGEHVERVRAIYQRSPKKSTTRESLRLQIPQPTVWKILRKRLKMTPYKLQLLQSLSDQDEITQKCRSVVKKMVLVRV
jgi:hypothetical protein